jgi:soluble P-type ATPase
VLNLNIPGAAPVELEHLVLDYNGTLALDGDILDGVEWRLQALSETLSIHLITADTFETVVDAWSSLPCRVSIVPATDQHIAKRDYVRELGAARVVAVGNGRNDALMLEEAALGIAVVQTEGAAREAVLAADVIVPDIFAALDLLANPLRLTATLRT